MSETIQVPKGWKLKTIPEIIGSSGLFADGDWVESKDQDPSGEIRLIQLADIGISIFKNKSNRFMNLEKAKKLNCTFLQKNDVLIARMPEPLGRACLFPGNQNKCVTVVDVAIIRMDEEEVNPKWLMYMINSTNIQNQILALQSGTTRKRISRKNLSMIQFHIPSISTQKQIVAKLDHILGELEVKKKEILSLIEQNKERIDVFEKNWMSYVIDREIENHPKRKEWQIMVLDKLCSKINDGIHKTPTYTKSGIPFISVRELQNDTINFQNCRYISESEHLELIKRCNPEYNDVLLSKTGSTIGKLAIVKESQKFSLFVNTALLKPLKNKIYSEFLLFSLKTFFNKKNNLSKIKTSAQPNLPINMIKKIEILLPPLPIQKQIIKNIKSAEQKFQSQKKQFENIKNNYESKINYINHIQSSVLDSAFSGKLLN